MTDQSITLCHSPESNANPCFVEVNAGVRYWEDGTINGVEDSDGTLIPLRKGDDWCPVIQLTDGKVLDWPEGVEAEVHYKVCDDGQYWLLNANRERIATWSSSYVPCHFLNCGRSSDYIVLAIGPDGFIKGWEKPEVNWACECGDEGSKRGWERLPQNGSVS